jgi:hypothetical protein
MVDAGLISRESADMLEKKFPHYVPFQRVFNEDEIVDTFSSKGVAGLSKQTVVQKMVGSDRAIESPLESFIELTNKMVVQGEKNKAAKTIASYKDIKGNPFGLRKVSSTDEIPKDKGSITFFEDGKKHLSIH